MFLAQTSISVFAVATVGTSTSPLLVLDAASGSVMANHSNEANVWGLSPTVAVTDGGRLLLIGRDTAVAGPTEYLFALNPRNGDASSGSFVPTLSTAQLQPVGGLCVVVPHGQGFTTFAASNTTLPVSYNLDSPGVQAVSTFNSSAVSPSVFVLFNANGGLAGFTCLA